MPTAAEYTLGLQKLFPDPLAVTPAQMKTFLEGLQEETDRVENLILTEIAKAFPVEPPPLMQLKSDMETWQTVLNYYKVTTNKAVEDGVGDVGPDGLSLFYKRVVGPLIDGQCYAPPSCSEAVLAQGAPVAVMPRAATPFQVETALAQNIEAVRENFSRFIDDMAGRLNVAFDVALDVATENVLKPFAIAAAAIFGIGGLIWLAGRPKRDA